MDEPTTQASPPGLPFEQTGRPFFPALVETVKLLVTDPTAAFRGMSLSVDLWRPLLYGVLIAWLAGAINYLWGLAVQASVFGVLSRIEGIEDLAPAFCLGVFGGALWLLIAPVFILIGIFVLSLIVHLCLMIAGGDEQGFATTLRVVSYSETAQLAQIVPFVGGIIALVWQLVLAIVGLAEAHRTTTGKAAVAVLLPFGLCCACLVGIFMLAVLTGVLSR